MARVFKGEKTFLHPLLFPVEKLVYRLTGIDRERRDVVAQVPVGGRGHGARSGIAYLTVIFMTQKWLPLNPQGLDNLSWHLAFNTAWSITCNADWQSYTGRDDDELPVADTRDLGAPVPERRDGARGPRRGGTGARARDRQDDRQLLGRSDPLHALHRDPAVGALGRYRSVWQGVPQTWKPYPTREPRRALHGAGPEDRRQGQPGDDVGAQGRRQGQAGRRHRRQARDGRPAGHGGPEGRDPAASRSGRWRRSSPASSSSPTAAAGTA